MSKALIIVVVAILVILGVRYYAPATPVAEPVAIPVIAPVSAAENAVDSIDLGAPIDSGMQDIDKDLNTL